MMVITRTRYYPSELSGRPGGPLTDPVGALCTRQRTSGPVPGGGNRPESQCPSIRAAGVRAWKDPGNFGPKRAHGCAGDLFSTAPGALPVLLFAEKPA